MPNAPPFVDGVVFSRGAGRPAVNLRARFGFERAPYDLRTRLLVVHAAAARVGLIVDARASSSRFRRRPSSRPATALTGLSGRYLAASRRSATA